MTDPQTRRVLPENHDCDECGCVFPDSGWHNTKDGLCLGCGGCGDPECCGGHDDDCRFAAPPPPQEPT